MAGDEKVFGIGLMKTGTSTLGRALHALGYRHRPFYPKLIRQLYRGETSELWNVADRYESFEDYPWPLVFKEIDERYPEAKFILTVRRDSETWYRSMVDHATRMGPTAERLIIFGYGLPHRRKQEHISQYEAHNDLVREHFADRPEKLLEVCWETGSTWSDVAEFLGRTDVELPERTPATNASANQSVSPRFWIRNTTKYVLIGKLKIDPFRHRNFTA
jgi:hypothetical protein